MHVARDGDAIVGGAGAFPFEPDRAGRPVPAAGVTVVGVLPTHRRRGILTRADARPARRHPRARRAGRLPVGFGGRDLRPLRLRDGFALRRHGDPAGRRGLRRPVDGAVPLALVARRGAASSSRPSGRGSRPRRRACSSAVAGLVGDARASRRGMAPAPAAARLRAALELDGRGAGVRALPAEDRVRGRRSRPGGRWCSRRWASIRRRPPRIWRYLLRHRLAGDRSRRACSRSTIRSSCCSCEPDRLRFRLADWLWLRLVDVGAALAGARTHRGRGGVRGRGCVLPLERGPLRARRVEDEEPSPICASPSAALATGLPRRVHLRAAAPRGPASRRSPRVRSRARTPSSAPTGSPGARRSSDAAVVLR